MVDYVYVGDKVIDFKLVVADWGSADTQSGGEFFGGTPVYAGPKTFNVNSYKDLFSFGRMAMELCMDKTGTESKAEFEQN